MFYNPRKAYFPKGSRAICKRCDEAVPSASMRGGLCFLCLEANWGCGDCGNRRGCGFFRQGVFDEEGKPLCTLCEPPNPDQLKSPKFVPRSPERTRMSKECEFCATPLMDHENSMWCCNRGKRVLTPEQWPSPTDDEHEQLIIDTQKSSPRKINAYISLMRLAPHQESQGARLGLGAAWPGNLKLTGRHVRLPKYLDASLILARPEMPTGVSPLLLQRWERFLRRVSPYHNGMATSIREFEQRHGDVAISTVTLFAEQVYIYI